ncbi:MAG: phosphatase PAP2 family protein [Methanosarcinales archaeon]|jgi:undecaprenyl-diphosphatase|nr:phosphatase PAP2 family protein [Methanosarcinales archaeon]
MNPIDFIQLIDSAVILQIHLAGGNSLFDFIAVLFSYLGTFRVGAVLLSIIFLLRKETRPLFFVLVAAVLLSAAVTWTIKEIVAHPRPFIWLGLTIEDILISVHPFRSFPSGHTATAFAAAAVAVYHFRKWAIPIFSLAVIMGLSRIYLLVHYPSDVIAGAIIGILSAVFVIWVFERHQRKNENGKSERKDETEIQV